MCFVLETNPFVLKTNALKMIVRTSTHTASYMYYQLSNRTHADMIASHSYSPTRLQNRASENAHVNGENLYLNEYEGLCDPIVT